MNNWSFKPFDGIYLNNNKVCQFYDNEEIMKDPKYNLYAYAFINDFGELYVKFGKAGSKGSGNTVYDRYDSTGLFENRKHMVGLWSSDKDDTQIHKELYKDAKCNIGFSIAKNVESSRETYKIESEIGLYNLLKKISEYAKDDIAQERVYQSLYENINELANTAVNDNNKNIILDLCPRFGKTRTALEIFQRSDERIMKLFSYVGTVRTSYKDDIEKLTNYENIKFIDPDLYENPIKIAEDWLDADSSHKVVWYVAITGSDNEEEKSSLDF